MDIVFGDPLGVMLGSFWEHVMGTLFSGLFLWETKVSKACQPDLAVTLLSHVFVISSIVLYENLRNLCY